VIVLQRTHGDFDQRHHQIFSGFVFFSAVSVTNAAKPSDRLIVIRVANFGWNVVANLKILLLTE